MTQHFDVNALELVGNPLQVAESVTAAANGRVAIAASETGVLAYRQGDVAQVDSELVWFDSVVLNWTSLLNRP